MLKHYIYYKVIESLIRSGYVIITKKNNLK